MDGDWRRHRSAAATGTGRGLTLLLGREALCAVWPVDVDLVVANLERATALARLAIAASAGRCSVSDDVTLVDSAPVVGARGLEEFDVHPSWLTLLGRRRALLSLVAGVRGLVAVEPAGSVLVELPDAMLAALIDDDDDAADDSVLTCDGRPYDANAGVSGAELLLASLDAVGFRFSRRAVRESGELLFACEADVGLASRFSAAAAAPLVAGDETRVAGGVRSQS